MILFAALSIAVCGHPYLDVKGIPLSHLEVDGFVRRHRTEFDRLMPKLQWMDSSYKSSNDETLKVTWDPFTNNFVASGPAASIAEFESYVGLFDVKPVHIKIECKLTRTFENESRSFTTTVENNESWTFGSSVLDLNVVGACRVGADGTITIEMKLTGRNVKAAPKIKTKDGLSATLGQESDPPKSGDFEISITPKIVE